MSGRGLADGLSDFFMRILIIIIIGIIFPIIGNVVIPDPGFLLETIFFCYISIVQIRYFNKHIFDGFERYYKLYQSHKNVITFKNELDNYPVAISMISGTFFLNVGLYVCYNIYNTGFFWHKVSIMLILSRLSRLALIKF